MPDESVTAPATKATGIKKRVIAKKAAVKTTAARKAAMKKAAANKAAARVERPYPRRALEEAIRVPVVLKEQYGGNAQPPDNIALALGYKSAATNAFFYQAA